MNTTLLKYDSRRLLPLWATSLSVLVVYVLLAPAPLYGVSASHGFMIWWAVLFGGAIAARLMADTGMTQAFVMTRGLTRRQILWSRMVLGAAVILVTTCILWLTLASGLRAGIHQGMEFDDAIYFPMVVRFEARITFSFACAAAVSLVVMAAMQTMRGLGDPKRVTTAAGQMGLWLIQLPLLLMLAFFSLTTFVRIDHSDLSEPLWPFVFSGAVVAAGALAIAVVFHFVTCQEVED